MIIGHFIPAVVAWVLTTFPRVLFTALFSREDRGWAGCLLAVLTVFNVGVAVLALRVGMFHQLPYSTYGPIIDMWHLVAG
jgi:hypothetical protein